MNSEEQHDPIVVERTEFQKIWMLLQEAPVPSQHVDRAAQLKSSYACFRPRIGSHDRSATRGHRRENHISEQQATYEYPAIRNMRPRIGEIFTNTEGKARKNFVAFMNKLSPQNKNSILESFVRSLVPENINIYIDQTIRLFQEQPSYHELYMQVLKQVICIEPGKARALIYEHMCSFIKNRDNMIPDHIAECLENIGHNTEQTDELCDYVRWKKKLKALLVFYVHVLADKICGSRDDVDKLFELLCSTVEDNWNNPISVDVYLDVTLHAISAMYSYYPKGLDTFARIAGRCKDWQDRTETLRPASRFKVLDIVDIINRNKRKK